MRSAPSTAPFFDPWAYVRNADALHEACRSADVPAILSLLRDIDDPEECAAALWTVADEAIDPDESGLTTAIREAQDGSPHAGALLATRYVAVGWSIRSHFRAQHVSSRQFELFHDFLRRAEGILFDVCSEFPEFLPAWETRITSARGLQLGASETRRRYEKLATYDPHHSRGQKAMLQQILPKWSGSWDESARFVQDCTSAAPAGSLSHLLVVDFAIEQHTEGMATAPGAALATVQQAAQQSVWHPDHVPGHGTAQAHADLAHFFSLTTRPADAKPHYDWLGDRPSKGTTFYYSRPQSVYRKFRAAAERAAKGVRP